ncbi:MAG: hypothetical protein WAU65_01185 [Candidatus Nanoarchaeia archaeon]
MIGGILDSAVFTSGGIGDALNNLAQLGFFSYAIPFLLIFALVFGILNRMGLFKENKGVTAIIALAVGLMSLQFNIVPQFFSQIFPNLGIGISIILVFLIVMGLFIDPVNQKWIVYILLAIAAIVAVVVVAQSSGQAGVNAWSWIQDNLGSSAGTIIIIVLVVVGIAAIVGIPKKGQPKDYKPFLLMPPGGQ